MHPIALSIKLTSNLYSRLRFADRAVKERLAVNLFRAYPESRAADIRLAFRDRRPDARVFWYHGDYAFVPDKLRSWTA